MMEQHRSFAMWLLIFGLVCVRSEASHQPVESNSPQTRWDKYEPLDFGNHEISEVPDQTNNLLQESGDTARYLNNPYMNEDTTRSDVTMGSSGRNDALNLRRASRLPREAKNAALSMLHHRVNAARAAEQEAERLLAEQAQLAARRAVARGGRRN